MITKEKIIEILSNHSSYADSSLGNIIQEENHDIIAEDILSKLRQPPVSGSLHLADFIEEIEYMQGLYSNARYTQAEATRDKLADQLDDLMRLGQQ